MLGLRQVALMAFAPERDAARLLAEAWLTDEDDFSLVPVDPVEIAHSLGIDVYTASMQRDFSGALDKKLNSDPVIYLNASDAPNRQRFSCAHELGHYYQRTLDGTASYTYTDRRDGMARTGIDAPEVYANRFGASLIMPEVAVKRLRRRLGVVELAHRFRVSEEAMRFRLKNLGFN